MRNLKRALSLALASVMLLGMMVVGSSAAGYDDVDQEDNVEAIAVLQAVKVMNGYDDGLFHPEANVTRNQMAKIICALKDVNESDFAGLRPYTDVPDWAANAVAACTAYKVVNGRGNGIYDGDADVTAIEAAAMMLRTLGYTELPLGDGWDMYVAEYASRIRLFEDIDIGNNEYMNRNQVAQLTLNALKSAMVEPDNNTIITMPDGTVISSGNINYVVLASDQAYARAIGRVEASSSSLSGTRGTIIELGEQLYNGKLTLDDTTDEFGRPASQWKYDGREIGTYAKNKLLEAQFTAKVTGKDLYDTIGKSIIDDIQSAKTNRYTLKVYIDGEDDDDVNDKIFSISSTGISKNNKDGVGDTGNGVLTQVYIDSDNKEVTVSIINTYLAKARADYNSKRDEVSFDVYGIEEKSNNNYVKTLTDGSEDKEPMDVSGEDFDIADVKKDDIYRVTVAEGEIQTLDVAEVIAGTSMSAFKVDDHVVAGGTTYKYSDAAEYDVDVLNQYTGGGTVNLKDKTYNIYLDAYGYLLGVELVDDVKNYVFITGVDTNASNRFAKNVDATAIFLDGTIDEITYDNEKSTINLDLNGNSNLADDNLGLVNTWCTYTVSKDGIYTLKQVAVADNANVITGSVDLAQHHDTAVVGGKIDKKNLSLEGHTGSGSFSRVYGNDDTVYLNAEVKTIKADSKSGEITGIIDDVDSVTVGVANAGLDVYTEADAKTQADANGSGTAVAVAYGAYVLYDDDGYIIAAVTVADDGASSDNWVYVIDKTVSEEGYDADEDEWSWTREVILNGEKTTIRESGDSLSELDTMKKYNWYKVRYKGDGTVKDVALAVNALNHSQSGAFSDEYEGNIKQLGTTIRGGKSTILYEASNYSGYTTANITSDATHVNTDCGAFTDQTTKPHLEGSTFFVSSSDTTGFHVDNNVKVVFIQTNKKNEDIEYSSGKDYLEDVVDELNAAEDDGKYDYEISAVLDSGSAKIVVVRDLNGSADNTTPVGPSDPPPPSGDYSSEVDATITTGLDALDLTKTANNKIHTDGKTLKLNVYGGGDVAEQIEDALIALGYSDISMAKDGTKYNINAKKGKVVEKLECDAKADGTGDVTYYWIVDVDDTKSYVAAGNLTVADPAKGANDGTGYIVSTDGGKTFAYGAAYGTNNYTVASDAVIKTGYVKVTVPAAKSTAEGLDYTITAPTVDYAKDVDGGAEFSLTIAVKGTSSGSTAKNLTATNADITVAASVDGTGTTTGMTKVEAQAGKVVFTPAGGTGAVDATYTVTVKTQAEADASFAW